MNFLDVLKYQTGNTDRNFLTDNDHELYRKVQRITDTLCIVFSMGQTYVSCIHLSLVDKRTPYQLSVTEGRRKSVRTTGGRRTGSTKLVYFFLSLKRCSEKVTRSTETPRGPSEVRNCRFN